MKNKVKTNKELNELKDQIRNLKDSELASTRTNIKLINEKEDLQKELDEKDYLSNKLNEQNIRLIAQVNELIEHNIKLQKELDELKNNSQETKTEGTKHLALDEGMQRPLKHGQGIVQSFNDDKTCSELSPDTSDSIIPKNRDQRLMKFGFDEAKSKFIRLIDSKPNVIHGRFYDELIKELNELEISDDN